MRPSIKCLCFAAALALLPAAEDAFAQRGRPTPKPIVKLPASVARPTPTPLSPDQQRRQDAFAKVWETIYLYYYDKNFGGLDWNKVRAEFQPRVAAAITDAQVNQVIEEMLGRLKGSHTGLLSPEWVKAVVTVRTESRAREAKLDTERPQSGPAINPEPDAFYGIGVELRDLGGRLVVASVEEQSAAAAAGIKPGFVLEKVNGVTVAELFRPLLTGFPSRRYLQSEIPEMLVIGFLNGPANSSVFLTCLDGDDKPREFRVPRLRLPGKALAIDDSIGEQYFEFRSASLSDDIGYINFNLFTVPAVEQFCKSISSFATKKAIIIDLRGNKGGLSKTVNGVAGVLTDHDILFGTSVYRDRTEPVTIGSKLKNYRGKLIVLVDRQTASAAELLSAGLQATKRALIVGEATAGEMLTAVSIPLPTNSVMQFPIATFQTANGKIVEGNGVRPDISVALDRASLLRGIDSQIDIAVSLIKDGTLFPRAGNLAGGSRVSSPTGDSDDLDPPPPKADPKSSPPVKNAAAQKVIDDFAAAIGGRDALKGINSYDVGGSASVGEASTVYLPYYHAHFQSPNRYSVSSWSPITGTALEVHDGKLSFRQSDDGRDDLDMEKVDVPLQHLFAPIANLIDPAYLTTLNYGMRLESNGRQIQLIDGTDTRGVSYLMIFDAATKMLLSVAGPGLDVSFDDYRPVEKVRLPFHVIIRSSSNVLTKIELNSIDLNTKAAREDFERRIRCFDKPL